MNEVSEKDFNNLYPVLKRAINDACFIAIDAEFTGIGSEDDAKQSLFDTLEERYQALKRSIDRYRIIQFGITLFHHAGDNAYKADCYSFHLFPKSLPFRNRQFTFQLSALEFLSTHKFDFNKLINEGISCLDEIDEEFLRAHIQKGDLIKDIELLSYDEEDDFKDCTKKVEGWLSQDPKSVSFQLPAGTPILQYMIQKELRNNIKNIWTTSGYKTVNVIRVTKEMRDLLEKEENNRLEAELLDTYMGFTKVFKLLSSCKKPLIGHNVLLDLMFIHQQFYRPLPDSYKQFKKNIHSLFPKLYDTKYISFQLKKVLDRDEAYWKLNSLSTLYEYFTQSGVRLSFNCPVVELDKDLPDTRSYHNAGWDSYFAGCIFIKMAHVFCVKKYGPGIESKPVTHTELMSSVQYLENRVNVTRCNETYIRFGGNDPNFSRPKWLHVKLKSSSINADEMVEKFSAFGQVDVMPFARRRFLVAASNHRTALCILQHFKDSNEFQVARYSRIWHAAPSTICLWSGLILSGGMAWVIKQMFLRASLPV